MRKNIQRKTPTTAEYVQIDICILYSKYIKFPVNIGGVVVVVVTTITMRCV